MVGSVETFDVKAGDVTERFWCAVDRRGDDECWRWLGPVDSRGDGRIYAGRRYLTAPRVSWTIRHGPVPPRACVRPRCGERLCTNPAHLELTRRRNFESMAGDLNPITKLTDKQALTIAGRLSNGVRVKELAQEFRVSLSTISRIKHRRRRTHLWTAEPIV